MSSETADTTALTIRRVIQAPREKLFRAWTDPTQMKRWFSPDPGVTIVSVDLVPQPGGAYRITMLGGQKIPFSATGTYREVVPPERLVFTWIWDDPDLAIGETIVTVQFNDQGGATELVLTHELFPDAEKRDSHASGWTAIVESLAKYIEG